jgi:Fe-Mn family superoxide dismutase
MKKIFCNLSNQNGPNFVLPALPFSIESLEPHMTKVQLELHHGKHHAAYVNNLNNLIGTNPALEGKSLEDIMIYSFDKQELKVIYNNAAQIWNHSFFWHCLSINGGGQATGSILEKIVQDFGSYDVFYKEFTEKALKLFGSGWCWLVLNKENKLEIFQSPNAENPMNFGKKPLMTLDVWEHAYYPDYQNRRADFIKSFLDHLVNWDFVNNVLEGRCSNA